MKQAEVKGLIYCVTNKQNQKKYIGQTIQSFVQRKKQHLVKAFTLNSKSYFHNALRKYGLNSFKWEIIDESDNINTLNELERKYILEYKSNEKQYGYNLTNGGLNYIINEETKQKLSLLNTGPNSPRYRIKHTDKSRNLMSMNRKGKRAGKDHPYFGKPRPLSVCKKIGDSQKGRGIFNLTGCHYTNKTRNPWTRVWQSHIQHNNKFISLGYFEDMVSAQIVHNLVREEIRRV